MPSREENIQSAIADLNAGIFKSQRQACKAYKIPRATLQGRMAGQLPHAIAHQQQQRLSPEQEEFLVEWILDEDSRAQPPSHVRVREMATRILRMNSDAAALGQLWVTNFLARQPRVSSIVGRTIEVSRAQAGDYATIQAFLELFERTRARLNIQVEDIWNMDETGIALGVCSNSQVIASARKRKAYVKTPGDREWVSIIEAISAAGRKLRCLVIFKGKSLQTTWFPSSSVPDWYYTTSENGWTSNPIGLRWLESIFIPESALAEGRNRLLLIDGHGSHTNIEFMWLCKQHRIHCLYLPAHTSHILQPLDLAPFSVLKSKYRNQIRALSALDDAAPVKKERFINAYNKARDNGMTERVLRAGWRAAGLVPYNPEAVLSSSQVAGRPRTPTEALPPQFPIDIILKTPQKAYDIYQAQLLLQRSESISRSTRLLLGKAGKAISRLNMRAAGLQADNERLLHQLGSTQKTLPRKRVKKNPNELFNSAVEIKAAIEEAAAKSAARATTTTQKIAEMAAAEAAALALQDMCTQFQI